MAKIKVQRNTKAAQQIWEYLLDNAGEKKYLSWIAANSGTANSTASQVLENQINRSYLIKEKIGNLSYYQLNPNDPYIQSQKTSLTIKRLRPLVNKLTPLATKIILFGSAAEGKNTAGSDIDLFILSDEKNQIYRVFSNIKDREKIKLLVKNFVEWTELKAKDRYFYDQINKGKVLWDKHEAV